MLVPERPRKTIFQMSHLSRLVSVSVGKSFSNAPGEFTLNETDSVDNFELGEWLGRRQAFGTIAGRCSAAEAECLRRIRAGKLYLGRSANWSDFCITHLGMTKQNADRIIRLLEEFGPAYFQLSQLVRISTQTYRQIAPSVSEGGLRVNGDIIALDPSNSEKLAAAVAELRVPKKPEAAPTGWDRLANAQHQFRCVTEELAQLGKGIANGPDRVHTKDIVRQMRTRLDRLELEI